MIVAFCLVALLPLISGRVAPNTSAAAIVSLVRWPALAVMTSLALALLYRLAPSRRGAKWRWVSPGALVATALWLSLHPCVLPCRPPSAAFPTRASFLGEGGHALGLVIAGEKQEEGTSLEVEPRGQ